MKLAIFMLVTCVIFAADDKTVPAKAIPAPAISKETLTELHLVDANERPIKEALQKVIDAALQQFNAERNEIVRKECAKYGANPENGECGLDLKAGVVVIKPKPDPPGEKK